MLIFKFHLEPIFVCTDKKVIRQNVSKALIIDLKGELNSTYAVIAKVEFIKIYIKVHILNCEINLDMP